MGRHVTIKVMGFLVFPLIACFLFLSLYLIRDWQPEHLTSQMQLSPQTLHQVWISIPVMVFAFSHTPIISTFAIDQQEKHGELAMGKCKNHEGGLHHHLRQRAVFVFSCLLAIPATYIETARDQGVTILSALSMVPARRVAGGDRHRRRGRDVEIVSRHLLWRD
jgi:amino acid permease